jgi:hypothetical protein
MNDVAREVYDDCLQECDSIQFGTCSNRSQGNVGTAIPDTNLTFTGTYGFRAVHMSVSSHEGIEEEQKYGSAHS